MLFLMAAIASNLTMTFLMRYSEHHGGHRYALNVWNYLSGALLSLLLLEDRSVLLAGDAVTLAAGIVNGIAFLAALTLMQVNLRRNGAPLSSTFNRVSVVIPAILSAIFFHEIPAGLQLTGLLICVFGILAMNLGAQKDRPAFVPGLIGTFLLGGATDFLSKVYSAFYSGDSQTCFVFYTFLAALAASLYLLRRDGWRMSRQDVLIGLGVGIPNQLSTLFLLRAASVLPAYLVFGTFSAGIIVLVNILNYAFFKETLTRRQYLATALIAAGCILINAPR